MRRRLLTAMLAAVAATLVLAGLGTLVLARLGSARVGEENLRAEVETSAALVRLGRTGVGAPDAAEIADLRARLCQPGSGAAPRDRTLLCTGGRPLLTRATDQLCTARGYLRAVAVPAELDASRQHLCETPGPDTLAAVRDSWCEHPPPGPNGQRPRPRGQLAFGIRAFCESIGSAVPPGDREDLAEDTVDLLRVDDRGTVVGGALPPGLGLADLRVDALRDGQTVSGPLGGGRFAAAAVEPAAPTLQVVVAARPDDPTAGLVPWFLLASGATLLLGTAVALGVSATLVEPLREASAATARIAAGDLDTRLPDDGRQPPRDEVAELSRSINAMAEALQASRAAERQFILAVSHDLRTPLTSIRGYGEAIADGASEPDRAAQVIVAESRRLERLVADLLQLGVLDLHQFTFHPVDVDLSDLAAESVDAVRRDVERAGLTLGFTAAPAPAPVHADPDRLGQVMANLVENAVKYAATAVSVIVDVTGDRARIEVADDGPGIPEHDLPHVFERRYKGSTAPVRRQVGTGLGLAIAREMVQAMGGTIDMANDPDGRGARVTIELALAHP